MVLTLVLTWHPIKLAAEVAASYLLSGSIANNRSSWEAVIGREQQKV